MKRILNKTTMAIVLALTMLFALVGGIFLVKTNGKVAKADDVPVMITATADTEAVFPGGSFKLTVDIKTTNDGEYHSVSLYIGALTSAGAASADDQKLFTLSNPVLSIYTDKNKKDDGTYDLGTQSAFQSTGMYKLSLAKDAKSKGLTATEKITITFDVAVSSSASDDALKDYYFGARMSAQDYITTMTSATNQNKTPISSASVSGSKLTNSFAQVELRKASTEKGVKLMKLGQGDTKDDLDTEVINETDKKYDEIDKSDIKVIVKDASAPLSIYIEFVEDGEKAVAKNGGTSDVTLDKSLEGTYARFGKIDIPSNNQVTLEVIAESGEKDTYTITIEIVSCVLENMVATTDTKVGTKTGVDGAFDSATVAYTVFVPSDSTKVDFVLTVSAGNNRVDKLTLDKASYSYTISGTDVTGNEVAIQTKRADFTVSGVSDDDVLVITCNAKKDQVESSKTYTITFKILSVDTSIDSITVTGATNGKASTNNAELASTNLVDYYFYIVGEGKGGQAKVVVTLNSSGAVVESIASNSYTPSGVTLGEGANYDITVAAEAGNKSHYKFTLKNKIALQLDEDSELDFLRLREFKVEEDDFKVVQSYTGAKWKHGIDDLNEPKFVIGKIKSMTSITEFLDNFSEEDQKLLRLYDGRSDEMLIDMGEQTEDYEGEEFDDPDYYAVGTGWYIEYVVDGEVADTIYLSVLGDLDGDGEVAGIYDVATLTTWVSDDETVKSLEIEFYMAASITESAVVGAGDIADIVLVTKKLKTLDSRFTDFDQEKTIYEED